MVDVLKIYGILIYGVFFDKHVDLYTLYAIFLYGISQSFSINLYYKIYHL